MSPFNRWYILWIGQALIPGGWEIRVMTDEAVHLQLIWRKDPPWKHKKVVIDRGFAMWEDARFCMGKRFIVYQEEAGDTRNHTFIWTGWEVCETRWFHFQATTPGLMKQYPTPVFSKHYIAPPQTVTFYPDPSPGVTCCDGNAYREFGTGVGSTWDEQIHGPGTGGASYGVNASIYLESYRIRDRWYMLYRGFLLFDTSIIPPTATILGATVRLWGWYKKNPYGLITYGPVICNSFPISNTDIVAADYQNIGWELLSHEHIHYADWKIDDWNEFTLNAYGRDRIVKGGITKFGVRDFDYDLRGVNPGWIASKTAQIGWYTAEKGDPFRPELVVTYQP